MTAIVFEDAYRAIEDDILDLRKMTRVADYLLTDADEEMSGAVKLIVEQAAKMANDLHEKYQATFPGNKGAA